MYAYECKGCGTLVFVRSEDRPPLWCPICRSSMEQVEVGVPTDLQEWRCPECEELFSMQKGTTPYKCAYCNYTFPRSPYRIQDERL